MVPGRAPVRNEVICRRSRVSTKAVLRLRKRADS